MPSLQQDWYRRLLFFTVYLIQTVLTVTTLSIFPLLFKPLGLNPYYYGVAGGLSLLPMAFKVLIGPLSDKFPIPFLRGRRRGYIILGGMLNAACLPFLAVNPITFAVLFFVLWFFQTLGIAIVDIMMDALIVGGEKSIQSMQGRTGASFWIFLGVFVGGAIATGFAGAFEGYSLTLSGAIDPLLLSILSLTAILAIIPVILIIFLREPSYSAPGHAGTLEIIKRNLKHPFVKWGLLFAFMLNIDAGLLELTLEPFVQTTLKVESLSAIVGNLFFISLLGTLLGALGYKFIDKIRKNRLLAIIALIYVIPSLILGVSIWNGTLTYDTFLMLYAVFGVVSGLSFVTYTAFFFDLSDPKAAGTMIALFLSVSNAGIVVGVMCGGFLPMAVIYFVTAVISGLRVIPLLKINMEDLKETFYGGVDRAQP